MKNFDSFLAPQLNDYMVYRQNGGYATKSLRSHLLAFDRYLKDKDADWNSFRPSFFLELRANLDMESRSVNRVLSTVRVLFQFLVRREYVRENPLTDIPPLKENAIIPFVFSPKHIDQLLKAACIRIRGDERYFLHDLAVYLAVLLLARCGMRISEPLRLFRHHYRRDDGTIYIERTKFKKDRLIPVPQEVMREIENYLAVRETLCPDDKNPYLLAGRKHMPLREYQVRLLFRQAVKDRGLDHPRKVIGTMNFSSPTPHSLRHSFAVNTLLTVKERGQSPRRALAVLATYMGHSEYKHTATYLTVVDAASRQGLVDFAMWHGRDT